MCNRPFFLLPGLLVIQAWFLFLPIPLPAYTLYRPKDPPIRQPNDSYYEFEWPDDSCIPSGDHTSIQGALVGDGAEAVLCRGAVFELSETVYFTAEDQSIYTEGLPTDSTRALLKIVHKDVATAVSMNN